MSMKIISLSLALGIVLTGRASATGLTLPIHACGEGDTSVKVNAVSMSAPGGPISRWTEAIVATAGQATGHVVVKPSGNTYVGPGFELVVWNVEKAGGKKRIDVSGRFAGF